MVFQFLGEVLPLLVHVVTSWVRHGQLIVGHGLRMGKVFRPSFQAKRLQYLVACSVSVCSCECGGSFFCFPGFWGSDFQRCCCSSDSRVYSSRNSGSDVYLEVHCTYNLLSNCSYNLNISPITIVTLDILGL